MKKVLMYDKHNIGKPIIELNRNLWDYDYYTNQSVIPNSRYRDSSLNPIRLIPFEYKGIVFNMITCPSGGKVNIKNWGEQEIKEPFMLGETQVTRELFKAVMGFDYSESNKRYKNPVSIVSWFDCLEFCNRLSEYFRLDVCYLLKNKVFEDENETLYPLSIEKATPIFIEWANGFRLPREWELQIAAMAGTMNKYAGTNDEASLKRVAWFDTNSGDKAHPVAQKMPNEWGFYDMSGNVYEWCENTFQPNQSNASSDARVFHGGAYNNSTYDLRTEGRVSATPEVRNNSIGFRIAISM